MREGYSQEMIQFWVKKVILERGYSGFPTIQEYREKQLNEVCVYEFGGSGNFRNQVVVEFLAGVTACGTEAGR